MYRDICKAFDCVNHEVILQRNEEVDIVGSLTDRTQYAIHQGIRSTSARVNTGIPQGSNLGLTLFLVYANDMCCMGMRSTAIQFADDTVMYYSDDNLNALNITVQQDLDKFSSWCRFNKLKVNAGRIYM